MFGSGICFEQVLRLRGQPRGRNPVALEHPPVRERGRAARVEDIDPQPAQVTLSFGRRRHAQQRGSARVAPRPLIVAKEEDLVPGKRSAERGAELVPLGHRNEAIRAGDFLKLRERVARVEDVVAQEVGQGAVEHVRARLRLRADHPCGRPELGVVVGGRDLRLGDRLEGRVHDDEAEQGIVVVGPVEQMRRSGEALPVHDLAIRPLGILARRRLRRRRLNARSQQLERGEAAVQDGQARDRLLAERRRDIAALGLQQGSPGAHFDGLAHLTDL